jgi:hypothetical protein
MSAAGICEHEEKADLGVRMWDPSTQLRYRAKRARQAA